jgi:nitroimidazol reductase NimA-like FMN-containing flavoprotein (pyridoxamine 5'-phosphate oxidase superfamily)
LPPDECLRLLASVPVGRVGFVADDEVVVLPVNHVVDGQDVIFRTAHGSKLSAAEGQNRAAFEADHYNEQTQAWWSVLVNGRAEVVDAEADIERLSLSLSRLGVYPWVTAVRHPFWIRIRPTSVSGRRTPGTKWASHPAGTLSASRCSRLTPDPRRTPAVPASPRRACDEFAGARCQAGRRDPCGPADSSRAASAPASRDGRATLARPYVYASSPRG